MTFFCQLSRGNMSNLGIAWYEKIGQSEETLISSNNDMLRLTLVASLPYAKKLHVSIYRCVVRNLDGVGSSPLTKLTVLRKGTKRLKTCRVPKWTTLDPLG